MRKDSHQIFSDHIHPHMSSLAASVSPPVMSRERFADLVGLPVGVIVGWCNKGLIPTYDIGKYSLINVALLQKRSIDREFA